MGKEREWGNGRRPSKVSWRATGAQRTRVLIPRICGPSLKGWGRGTGART